MIPSRIGRTLFCASWAWLAAGAIPASANPALDPVELGKRIYQQGILPDGSPLTALHAQGTVATGADAACVNCHRPSGYGSMEGTIEVPPIAGAVLFAPGAFAAGSSAQSSRGSAPVERFRARSAYDDDHLARALRDGLDPDGLPLDPLMPRYRLDDTALAALAAYLRQLSSGPVPGVEPGNLHLGTVITPDVPAARREAVLSVLRNFAEAQEKWGTVWHLHVWQLTGAPREWGAQLEKYYRQQPVFALLSGAGGANWEQVHRFCEQHAVACILPSVEEAPETGSDYYSVYFSPGLPLEAGLLTVHLKTGPAPPKRLLQVVSGSTGRRAAAAVRQRLAGSHLAVEQLSPQEYAARLGQLTPDDAVVLWLRPEELAPLMDRPPPAGELFLSALLAPPEDISPPRSWKAKLRYLSVFDPQGPLRSRLILRPWLNLQGLSTTELRARADAYGACNFFNDALAEIRKKAARGIPGPLTRERLLDTMEDVMTVYRDDNAPFYWRMSLGPGQRIPVRGGVLLRYAGNELVAEGDRIVP